MAGTAALLHPRGRWDAVVIGAGYFGCRIAVHLAARGMDRVLLVEEQHDIMSRASLWNQARVHGGYHYPRAYLTARASRRSYSRFLHDHPEAIVSGMRALYAIARSSRVSPSQFERLCVSIGAPLQTAPAEKKDLFDADLIEAVYEVEEAGFDASVIAAQLRAELAGAGVTLALGAAARVETVTDHSTSIVIDGAVHSADRLYNCAYASLDSIGVPLRAGLKREWTEMTMVAAPAELAGWGVTVMDGPFFSMMPFPHQGCHTLSHVRYTPVCGWRPADRAETDAHEGAEPVAGANAGAMLRDATRYLPRLRDARILGSIHSVKTVLDANENDDGRPLLVEQMTDAPHVVSVLGSKLDNVYDVLDEIDDLLDPTADEPRRQYA